MPDLHISAQEAQRSVRAFQHEMNRGRRLPRIAKSTMKAIETPAIVIFNVGPWKHERSLGSMGMFTIPACPKGEVYAAMAPLAETVLDFYPKNEQEMAFFEEDGMYLAEQILGIGAHLSPADSLLHKGVGIAKGLEPTAGELKRANDYLSKTFMKYVRQARAAYAKGPKEYEATVREDPHFLSARALNLMDEAFMKATNADARQVCPVDGTISNMGIVLCPTCRYIFNEKKYAELKARIAS